MSLIWSAHVQDSKQNFSRQGKKHQCVGGFVVFALCPNTQAVQIINIYYSEIVNNRLITAKTDMSEVDSWELVPYYFLGSVIKVDFLVFLQESFLNFQA